MSRLLWLVLASLLLSGCSVQYSNDDPDASGAVQHTSTTRCTVNGRPCDSLPAGPTGPNETIDMDVVVDLSMGADQGIAFSVHNGSTETSLQVRRAGYDGLPVGAAARTPCITVQGPGTSFQQGVCGGSGIAMGPNLLVDGVLDQVVYDNSDLGVGDWRVHVRGDADPSSIVITAIVHY